MIALAVYGLGLALLVARLAGQRAGPRAPVGARHRRDLGLVRRAGRSSPRCSARAPRSAAAGSGCWRSACSPAPCSRSRCGSRPRWSARCGPPRRVCTPSPRSPRDRSSARGLARAPPGCALRAAARRRSSRSSATDLHIGNAGPGGQVPSKEFPMSTVTKRELREQRRAERQAAEAAEAARATRRRRAACSAAPPPWRPSSSPSPRSFVLRRRRPEGQARRVLAARRYPRARRRARRPKAPRSPSPSSSTCSARSAPRRRSRRCRR